MFAADALVREGDNSASGVPPLRKVGLGTLDRRYQVVLAHDVIAVEDGARGAQSLAGNMRQAEISADVPRWRRYISLAQANAR